jgi:hypothetical protein
MNLFWGIDKKNTVQDGVLDTSSGTVFLNLKLEGRGLPLELYLCVSTLWVSC